MTSDFVFAPEPDPEPTTSAGLIDWAQRSTDDELARIIDDAANGERDH